MSFRNLDISISYSTKKSNPVEQFFKPVLSSAITYNVAVGYFSSAWIRDNSFGIAKFAENNGKAKWIISPFDLSKEDRSLFIKAYKSKNNEDEKYIRNKISHSFNDLYNQLQNDARIALAWLIHDEIIEFKFGIPYTSEDEKGGILHSKMGIFRDAEGNEISFSGSYNLTGQAKYNWERFDVFKSWDSETDLRRTTQIKEDLDSMWQGDDETLLVFRPTEDNLTKFKSLTQTTIRPYILHPKQLQKIIQIPKKFLNENGRLRGYQEEAIDKWWKQNGRGVFHMATGSGKTATALSASVKLYQKIVNSLKKPLAIIITVPFVSLAKQWIVEAETFNFEAIACFSSREEWLYDFQSKLQRLKNSNDGCLFIVTVNKSLTGQAMQTLIEQINFDFLFIGDEMHNLGAENNLKSLPKNANFRLGLSATPDREYDEEGTKSLERYFGSEVIEFTINDAIEKGFLCQYFYYPILIDMNDDEWTEYIALSNLISRSFNIDQENGNNFSTNLQNLLFKRARLLGKIKNKSVELIKIMGGSYLNSTHMIIYCGDSKDGDDRQVDIITKDIVNKLSMRVNKFTAEENAVDREIILNNFKEGKTQALIAIKCLDEGIDIPKTETAFILASSSTMRQFIQRRGRVLRKAPDKKYAYIYDFITLPRFDESNYSNFDTMKIERMLFSRELKRVNQFSLNALNPGHTLELLRPIKQKLDLMSM